MIQDETQAPLSLEISEELVHRIDALAYRLERSALGRHLHLDRELVIRLALLHGIEELERLGQDGAN